MSGGPPLLAPARRPARGPPRRAGAAGVLPLLAIDARLGAPFLPASKAPRTGRGRSSGGRPDRADPPRPAHLQRPPDGALPSPDALQHRVDGARRAARSRYPPPPPSLPPRLPYPRPPSLRRSSSRSARCSSTTTPLPARTHAAATPPTPRRAGDDRRRRRRLPRSRPFPHSRSPPPPPPLRPRLAEVQHKEVVGLCPQDRRALAPARVGESRRQRGGGGRLGPRAAAEAASRTARTRALCISLLRRAAGDEWSSPSASRRMLQIWGKIGRSSSSRASARRGCCSSR